MRIVRLRPAELELHTWAEMERMQDQLLEAHRCQMLFVDPSNSAMPFVVCALQSAACQLEQERFVDVLQFLAAYRERRCGCWAAQVSEPIPAICSPALLSEQRRVYL